MCSKISIIDYSYGFLCNVLGMFIVVTSNDYVSQRTLCISITQINISEIEKSSHAQIGLTVKLIWNELS